MDGLFRFFAGEKDNGLRSVLCSEKGCWPL